MLHFHVIIIIINITIIFTPEPNYTPKKTVYYKITNTPYKVNLQDVCISKVNKPLGGICNFRRYVSFPFGN